eukprot:5800223-Alexandrium_andersonii.AAC.1
MEMKRGATPWMQSWGLRQARTLAAANQGRDMSAVWSTEGKSLTSPARWKLVRTGLHRRVTAEQVRSARGPWRITSGRRKGAMVT